MSKELLSRMANGVAGIRQTIDRNQRAQAAYTQSTLERMSDFQSRAQENPDAAAFLRVINASSIQVKAVHESAAMPYAKTASASIAAVTPIRQGIKRMPNFSRLDV